jgi:hypothetical protein
VEVPQAYAQTEGRGCQSTRGAFAFYYAPFLNEATVAWLKGFNIVVTGSVLPDTARLALKGTGRKLFLYHWLTGFYLDDSPSRQATTSWESFARHSRPHWLLNPDKPHAGPDGQGRAYYYDPAPPDLKIAWARQLARVLRHASYDGVFFDLVGSLYVPEELQKVYARRHPDRLYDADLSGFLRELKKASPKSLIFTNQGYRTPGFYLPAADYDLSESLMTSYVWGERIRGYIPGKGSIEEKETFYRPWTELKVLVNGIAAEVRKHNPRIKVYHLNYVNPLYMPMGRSVVQDGQTYPLLREEVDRPAIYYGYAASKLFGHESYSPVSERMDFKEDDIYFADLGRPLGESYEERDGLVRRYYENGIVALNPGLETRTASLLSGFIPAHAKGLWDCYERKPISGFRVTIEPTVSSASARSYPAGRVYLYLRS